MPRLLLDDRYLNNLRLQALLPFVTVPSAVEQPGVVGRELFDLHLELAIIC